VENGYRHRLAKGLESDEFFHQAGLKPRCSSICDLSKFALSYRALASYEQFFNTSRTFDFVVFFRFSDNPPSSQQYGATFQEAIFSRYAH
jgi:hypothetical protein